MPDENSSQVGNTQTSQGDQAVKNQSGNDFVLDFGDVESGEVKENSTTVVDDIGGVDVENNENQTENGTDNDYDVSGAFDDGDGKEQDDFNISLDSNPISEDSVQANNDNNFFVGDDSSAQDDGTIQDDSSTQDDGILQENSDAQNDGFEFNSIENENVNENVNPDDNLDFNIDMQHSEDKNSDEKVDLGGINDSQVINNQNGDSEENSDLIDNSGEINDNNIFQEIQNDEVVEENKVVEKGEFGDDFVESEFVERTDGENSNEGLNLDLGVKVEKDESEENYNNVSQSEVMDNAESSGVMEGNFSEDGVNGGIDVFNSSSVEEVNKDNNAINFGDGEVNNNVLELGLESQEAGVNENVGSQPVDLKDNDANNGDSLTQPEIGDLLGENSVDSSNGGSESNVFENDFVESNEPLDSQVSVDVGENSMEKVVEEQNDQNQTQNIDQNTDQNIGSQNFVLDYQDSVAGESSEVASDESVNGNAGSVVAEGVQSNFVLDQSSNNIDGGVQNLKVDDNPENQNSDVKNVDTVKSEENEPAGQQVTSTLSLDQILGSESDDSELGNSLPGVSNNVSTQSNMFGNKKMVGILAGVGLFLLAGVVAVLSFGSGGLNLKAKSVIDTEIEKGDQVVEEYVDDNTSVEGYSDERDEEGGTEILDSHTTTVVEQDFPDVDWEEDQGGSSVEQSEGSESEDIKPYTCEGDDCSYNQNGGGFSSVTLNASDIKSVISDFESQAEMYYSQGEEMKDKKLLKYALQAINLCEVYENQVENGEGINDDDFSLFKSRLNRLLTKMEEYLGGEESGYETSYFDNDTYDFEGKEELRDYLYERDSI